MKASNTRKLNATILMAISTLSLGLAAFSSFLTVSGAAPIAFFVTGSFGIIFSGVQLINNGFDHLASNVTAAVANQNQPVTVIESTIEQQEPAPASPLQQAAERQKNDF